MAETQSGGGGRRKRVPWISWAEWRSVGDMFSSADEGQRGAARKRVTAWLTRCPIPVSVQSTFDLSNVLSPSPPTRESHLAAGMSLVRFVNGVTSRMQTKEEFARPLVEIAAKLGLPAHLVAARHMATHGDQLPSREFLAAVCRESIAWLAEHYWGRQLSGLGEVRAEGVEATLREYRKVRRLKLSHDGSEKKLSGLAKREKAALDEVVRAVQTVELLNSALLPCLVGEGGLMVPVPKKSDEELEALEELPQALIAVWEPALDRFASEWRSDFVASFVLLCARRSASKEAMHEWERAILFGWCDWAMKRYGEEIELAPNVALDIAEVVLSNACQGMATSVLSRGIFESAVSLLPLGISSKLRALETIISEGDSRMVRLLSGTEAGHPMRSAAELETLLEAFQAREESGGQGGAVAGAWKLGPAPRGSCPMGLLPSTMTVPSLDLPLDMDDDPRYATPPSDPYLDSEWLVELQAALDQSSGISQSPAPSESPVPSEVEPPAVPPSAAVPLPSPHRSPEAESADSPIPDAEAEEVDDAPLPVSPPVKKRKAPRPAAEDSNDLAARVAFLSCTL